RGTAGAGVGRGGRPVHHHGEGDHEPVARQTRRAAADRDRATRRLPDPRIVIARLVHGQVRVRLTLLYGGLFVLAGAALLAITYVLFAHSPRPPLRTPSS